MKRCERREQNRQHEESRKNKRSSLHDFFVKALGYTLSRYWAQAVLMLAAIVLGARLASLPSAVLRQFVDGPLQDGAGGYWRAGFLYLGALVLIAVTDLVREYGSLVVGQRMLLRLRGQMLERMRLLPMGYYWRTSAGDTLSRLTADIDAVDTLFTAGVISAAADLLKIAGLVTALFALSVPLGWVAVGSLPVLYVLSDFFRRRIFTRQMTVRKRVSDINTSILETYSGRTLIKAYGLEAKFAERFEPVLENHRLAMNANSVYDAWFPVVMQIVRAVVIALAISLGASANLTPVALGLSLGTLAAAADLFMRLFDPIEAAAGELQTIQQGMAGLRRIRDFFALETENRDVSGLDGIQAADEPENNESPAILVQLARFAYVPGKEVLKEASLVVPSGWKAAVAGRTGSGKTTLLQLVAGLYPASAGTVLVHGKDPYRLPPQERRRLIGMVPQTVTIFHGSVLENVTLRDPDISEKDVEWALEQVGLLADIRKLPDTFHTLLGEGESKLSFGQNQLLSLARAIVTNPPVLLLDELTSGLDALTEKQVLEAIRTISGGRTILTISHRLSGLLDAQTVHIMEHGRIVESGAPEALAEQEGWYARYRRLEDNGWQV